MPVLDFLGKLFSPPKSPSSSRGVAQCPVSGYGLWECDVLQCDSGLGASPSFLLCVIWPGVHLSMKVLEAETWLAHQNAAGPTQAVVCRGLIFFYNWEIIYVESLLHPLYLKKVFFLIVRLVHIYTIKIPNKQSLEGYIRLTNILSLK